MEIVIGIDGGGTHTHAVAAGLGGRVLATAYAGGASPNKTPDAQRNVRGVIAEVLARAGGQPKDVRALVAGLAGLDAPEDQAWAERFTALRGLACPRVHVNDAVVAHAGALASEPGVIAIAGTGSNVFGVTEDGRQLYGDEFQHYARTAARYLSFAAVHGILAGQAVPEDAALVDAVVAHWEVADVAALREKGAKGFVADALARNRRFGEMAPLVTAAAGQGAPLARQVCDRAAEALSVGIKLVGGCFTSPYVRVALIGSVANDAYMKNAIAKELGRASDKRYPLVAPQLSGASGAALMALRLCGDTTGDDVREHLSLGVTTPARRRDTH